MIFAHTLEKIIRGDKSQTRRLVKAGEYFDTTTQSVIKTGKRTLYKIGQSYAVQPNRGKKSVARIQITGLRKECVAAITEKDAQAEGFASRADFLKTWHEIHGQDANLGLEVWVLEFELCLLIEDALEAWHENRNAENKDSHHSKDLSSTLQEISGSGMHSGYNGSRRMGPPVSDRLSLSSGGSTVQEVSMD